MFKRLDIAGQKFNRWTVLRFDHTDKRLRTYWHCRCDCGIERVVLGATVTNGTSKSCGCYMREANGNRLRTHGMIKHPIYWCWRSMKDRCYNPNTAGYKDYGGRGITICARWLESFENFYADMGASWKAGRSIDRYPNNDGNYEIGNCRWATPKEQMRNRRVCRYIQTPKGRMTVTDAGEMFSIDRRTIFTRLRHGWPESRLLEPVVPATISNLTGQTFGKWGVLRLAKRCARRNFGNRWWCRCACGTEREVLELNLIMNKSASCGCARIRNERGIFESH